MKCKICNTDLRDGAKFCPQCGSSIAEQVIEAKSSIVVCPNCGNSYDKEFGVCPSCGTIYEEEQPMDAIGTIMPEISEVPVCPNCGKEIAPGKSFCKYCGTKLNNVQTTAKSAVTYEETRQEPAYSAGVSNRLLSLNEFLIDEKVSAFKFENSYKIYDMNGNLSGAIIQERVSGGAAAARVLMGKSTKAFQKFRLDVVDASGNKVCAIYREGGGFSDIIVENNGGSILVTMKIRLGTLKDENGNFVCKFSPGFTTSHLKDEYGNEIASVQQKWNGAKSLFTTADKYRVNLSPALSGNTRLIIFAVTCAYDMLAGDR